MKPFKTILFLFLFISNPAFSQIHLIDSIKYAKSVKSIETLIDKHQLDVNLSNSYTTPLVTAANYSDLEMVKMLLRKGAKINLMAKNINTQATPLMTAIRSRKPKIAELLLEQGADISIQNFYGETALYYAVKKQQMEIIKTLVEKGADLNIKKSTSWDDILGQTFNNIWSTTDPSVDSIFYYLVEHGAQLTERHLNIVLRVNNKPRINFILSKGIKPSNQSLHNACHRGDLDLVRRLINEYDLDPLFIKKNGSTCLHAAISNYQAYYPDLVKYLLEQKINVNQANNKQETAFTETFKHLKGTEAITIGKMLLERGAKINHIESNFNRSALTHAVNHNDLKGIQFLLKNGADINLQGDDGETPLHQAASENNSTLLLLLKNGANPNIQTDFQMTPLMRAVIKKRQRNVKDLIKYGADINLWNKKNLTALDYCNNCKFKDFLKKQGARKGEDLDLPMLAEDTLYKKMFVQNDILWVLVNFGNLYAFDLNTKKLLPNHSIIGQKIYAATPYIDNKIAFSTSKSVIKTWDYTTQKLMVIDTLKSKMNTSQLLLNSKNELYTITDNAIINITTKQSFTLPDTLIKNVFGYYKSMYGVSAMLLDSKDNLWVGMDQGEFGGGLFVFNTKTKRFEKIQIKTYPYIDYVVNIKSFYEDDSGFVYSTASLAHMSSAHAQVFKFNQQFEGQEMYYAHRNDSIIPPVIYAGIGRFNHFLKQHFIYTPSGFFIKNDTLKGNHWTWDFYYSPRVPNNERYVINVRDIHFLDKKRLLLLSTWDGIGLYDGKELSFFKL